jgi:hypothetical protein
MKAVQIQSYKDYPVWGRILRRQEIAGSVLSETAYIPHFSGPRHVHDQVGYFCLTLQGGYTEILEAAESGIWSGHASLSFSRRGPFRQVR